MIKGQILVYHFNGLHNAKEGVPRNHFTLTDVDVSDKLGFRTAIEDALDQVPPGRGYALVKWDNRIFICEKDSNNPSLNYVRHEVLYHPLAEKFTI